MEKNDLVLFFFLLPSPFPRKLSKFMELRRVFPPPLSRLSLPLTKTKNLESSLFFLPPLGGRKYSETPASPLCLSHLPPSEIGGHLPLSLQMELDGDEEDVLPFFLLLCFFFLLWVKMRMGGD